VISIFVHEGGETRHVDYVDPAWLLPGSRVTLWVDIDNSDLDEERRLLADVFHFHELAIEDALLSVEHPKVEAYEGYLYLVLHGIDFEASRGEFRTHDIDFFLGPNYLVTHHDGSTRTISEMRRFCPRNDRILGEGPAALLHRIVNSLIDHYVPEVDRLEENLEALEHGIFTKPPQAVVQQILHLRREVAAVRRVIMPQRDAIARLARHEFAEIPQSVAYRFRDVYDHLVRLADTSIFLQDRLTGVLEAHLSNVSYRLNDIMRVLTILSTIFMPLTVLTGMYGMNVPLPMLPGGENLQFWWVALFIVTIASLMLVYFRRRRWW
jgi:magnesium transporter